MVEHLAGYAQTDLMIPALPDGGWPDLAAANTAARNWCAEVNACVHSETYAVPVERLASEREILRPLPSLRPPLRASAQSSLRATMRPSTRCCSSAVKRSCDRVGLSPTGWTCIRDHNRGKHVTLPLVSSSRLQHRSSCAGTRLAAQQEAVLDASPHASRVGLVPTRYCRPVLHC